MAEINQILSNITDTTFTTEHSEYDIDIEIGDVKQEEFFPRVKFKKWDNESNLSVGIIETGELSEFTQETDEKIIWETNSKIANFYSLDDGYEFEIILKEKPVSNIIDLSIETKDLRFEFQPYLTEEESYTKSRTCPENAEGSYAVYHTYKKNNIYRTGKAFHIYRPKIFDAQGRWAWGSLNINVQAGILQITIPQSILNDGTYPLVVDPEFGYSSVGSQTQAGGGGKMTWYGHGDSNGVAGTLTEVHGYFKRSAAGADTCGCTYGNNNIYDVYDGVTSRNLTTSFQQFSDTGLALPISAGERYITAGLIGSPKRPSVAYDISTGTDGGNVMSEITLIWTTDNTKEYSVWAVYEESGTSYFKRLLKAVH